MAEAEAAVCREQSIAGEAGMRAPVLKPTAPARRATITQPWKCRFCGKRGQVEHRADAGPVVGWDMVVDAHSAAAPGCHRDHGSRGVYLTTEAMAS
jgi:hypothetical protein